MYTPVFMKMALGISESSRCQRRQVGCVLVNDGQAVAAGVNGAPMHSNICLLEGCYRLMHNIPSGEQLDKCFAVHAEQAAILQAVLTGRDIYGAEAYLTCPPCMTCLKLLAHVGCKDIYCLDTGYEATDFTAALCRELDIDIVRIPRENWEHYESTQQ